jgi:hypothetical protein
MTNFDILAWFALNWKLSFLLPNQVLELSPFHWDSRVSQLREDIGWVVRPEDPLRSGYPDWLFSIARRHWKKVAGRSSLRALYVRSGDCFILAAHE